jgi:HlyD family secretion protein
VKEMLLKHKKRILGGMVLMVLIGAAAVGYNALQDDKARDLEALTPPPEQSRRLNFWGEVKYDKIYDISIDFPSIVTDIKVKEGDAVSLGQVLMTLDMSEYLSTVNKLRQQLAAGQAGLQNILQDTASLEADVAQTQKDIATKTAELNHQTDGDLRILQVSLNLAKKEAENAARDVKDNQALYDTGAVSQSTLNQYKDILTQREKALEDVKIHIEKTQKALQTELDQLNIALKSKRAQLAQLKSSNSANMAKQSSGVAVSQIDLDMMKNKGLQGYLNANQIISPVRHGIIQNIRVIDGTRLGVQNTPASVLQLIDADSIVVSAEVEEEFINKVALGDAVSIVPISDSSLTIPGTVAQISNVAVEKDGKRIIKVQIRPQDTDSVLKPGYSVDVYLQK